MSLIVPSPSHCNQSSWGEGREWVWEPRGQGRAALWASVPQLSFVTSHELLWPKQICKSSGQSGLQAAKTEDTRSWGEDKLERSVLRASVSSSQKLKSQCLIESRAASICTSQRCVWKGAHDGIDYIIKIWKRWLLGMILKDAGKQVKMTSPVCSWYFSRVQKLIWM